jgi:hypothetical protein
MAPKKNTPDQIQPTTKRIQPRGMWTLTMELYKDKANIATATKPSIDLVFATKAVLANVPKRTE